MLTEITTSVVGFRVAFYAEQTFRHCLRRGARVGRTRVKFVSRHGIPKTSIFVLNVLEIFVRLSFLLALNTGNEVITCPVYMGTKSKARVG